MTDETATDRTTTEQDDTAGHIRARVSTFEEQGDRPAIGPVYGADGEQDDTEGHRLIPRADEEQDDTAGHLMIRTDEAVNKGGNGDRGGRL